MADAATRFNAELGLRGDAGESLRWMCLTGQDAGRRWILWLESGEIHGGDIGGFRLQRIRPNQDVDPRCRRVPGSVDIHPVLTLGASRAAVERTLGKPGGVRGSTSIFVYEHHEADQYTTLNTTHVDFVAGAVDAIGVWRTITL